MFPKKAVSFFAGAAARMKYFAITPEDCSPLMLTGCLSRLKGNGVSFLYLRSHLLYNDIALLLPAVSGTGIVPIVPSRLALSPTGIPFGLHFKSSEHSLLTDHRDSLPELLTVSCHDAASAVRMLEGPARYVFVSPVFTPLSKREDVRPLFPGEDLKKLVHRFGERVVVLGGMSAARVSQLQNRLQHDFSVAGISMFFG